MKAPFVQTFSTLFKNAHTKIDIIKYGGRHLVNWDDAVLFRPFWRIFWVNGLGGRLHHNNTTLNLTPGSLAIIPPYLEMKHEHFEEFDIFYMHVDIEKPFHTYPEIFQIPISQEHLLLVKSILEDPYSTNFVRQAELQTLALKVLMNLNVDYFKLDSLPNKISDVILYMEKNLHAYLSNEVLAEFCLMPKNSFIRLFSQETNIPPQEYLRNIRLDASANLLAKSKLSIEEICERCGFSERNYFSRVFSKRFKMGPVSYRKAEV